MAHINTIGASMFSDLAFSAGSAALAPATLTTSTAFAALFATEIESVGGTKAAATFVRVKNVREFPSMGTPPNITNVPVYGQTTSQQVQGQSDAPNLEITLNYVPADWAEGTILGDMLKNKTLAAMRFTLLQTAPTGTGATRYASTVSGIGTVQNSTYYWVGKVEALLVNPQLTDATTATITMSLQSDFYGAYTLGP